MRVIPTCLMLFAILAKLALSTADPRLPDERVRTIYEFPNGTWVENLAVRSNGNILVTLVNIPEVWEVDPSRKSNIARLIFRFPQALSALGIAEYAPDVFAINVGNFSLATGAATPGSWSVWSLDMSRAVHAHKITDIPAAVFLNGMTSLPANPTTVLVADSGAGKIFAVDTRAGSHSVVISGPFLQPNTSAVPQIGVNGIQFRPNDSTTLYFDNSFKPPGFASIPVEPSTGKQAGPVDVISKRAQFPTNLGFAGDDFTFRAAGDIAYLATNAGNSLVKIDVGTKKEVVVVGGVNSSVLVGPTACKFGRTVEDLARGRLYVVTNGGLADPPPSGFKGGKVVAVDVEGW